MKRLVVCCDGTWKRADDRYVSNIEKIARAIAMRDDEGNVQPVHYSAGVGTGAFKLDRILGGAFGVGLDDNLLDAYRFLALNYDPDEGDEICIFGFSRGAYTARSLVGMINYLGLLTPAGIVDPPKSVVDPLRRGGVLRHALDAYRKRPDGSVEVNRGTRYAPFEGAVHETMPRIGFLGVFDTVGALGIPGLSRRRHRFHDVELPSQVDVARQALAIDERRRIFSPAVWEKGKNKTTNVRQVWFEGVHCDIGGGYENHAPSDLTLRWMVSEAAKCKLAFDWKLLRVAGPDESLTANESLKLPYWILNQFGVIGDTYRRIRDPHRVSRLRRGRRILERENDAGSVLIAQPADDRKSLRPTERRVAARNVDDWMEMCDPLPVEKVPTIDEIATRRLTTASASSTPAVVSAT
ncbi:MAG TPA: DUF2235 domain-containing protein [Aldersonia sp.]